jgi:hypothetical protein
MASLSLPLLLFTSSSQRNAGYPPGIYHSGCGQFHWVDSADSSLEGCQVITAVLVTENIVPNKSPWILFK